MGKRRLAEELKLALEQGDIIPFYQLQLDAHTREIVGDRGTGALAHSERGTLCPVFS